MVQSPSRFSAVAALTAEEVATVERVLATSGALRLVAASGFEMHLPVRVRDGLFALLEGYARGRGVVVTPVDDTLTTQEAAVLLGVSRPTLVRLLETGVVPFHQPRTHRRVRLQDVLDYRHRMRRRTSSSAHR